MNKSLILIVFWSLAWLCLGGCAQIDQRGARSHGPKAHHAENRQVSRQPGWSLDRAEAGEHTRGYQGGRGEPLDHQGDSAGLVNRNRLSEGPERRELSTLTKVEAPVEAAETKTYPEASSTPVQELGRAEGRRSIQPPERGEVEKIRRESRVNGEERYKRPDRSNQVPVINEARPGARPPAETSAIKNHPEASRYPDQEPEPRERHRPPPSPELENVESPRRESQNNGVERDKAPDFQPAPVINEANPVDNAPAEAAEIKPQPEVSQPPVQESGPIEGNSSAQQEPVPAENGDGL